MVDYKTPGVWIEELPATGPIAGVGTSNAALIGAALGGPIAQPTMVTNFTQFRDTFGGYITLPGHYLAHAVRGFFDNGGTVAYIVRVGTAQRAFLALDDRGGGVGRALRVEATKEGVDGNTISVQVQNAQLVAPGSNARVRRVRVPTAAAGTNAFTLANVNDAQLFRVDDIVIVEATAGERRKIVRISGDQLVLDATVTASAASNVRIADLALGQTTFRVENVAGIEPGSAIHIEQQGGNQEDRVVRAVVGEFVTLEGAGLQNTYGMDNVANDVKITSFEFTLVITKPATTPETYAGLSMDSRHSHYFARVVTSQLVTVTLPAPPTLPSNQVPPLNRPLVIGATPLAGGADDNLATIGLNHYTAALAALEKVDDVQIVATPGRTDTGVQTALIAHCEKLKDRFAILDAARNATPLPSGAGSVGAQRGSVDSARGYAALYYPWILTFDPASLTGDDTMLVPPSGHLAGIYARNDSTRGVHKAPANELITGAIGLERTLDDVEQGELNVLGVNVLRVFPNATRPTVWGARTTTPKDLTPWRYINVRRLFLYVEESIQKGVRWAVFEPNDLGLWKKLDRTISEFLTRVWRDGALFGATREQAFYVKIDEELNPASVRALGQVIIEIGIAPVRPAEFVVVRIGMWDGGSEVTEG
jgi:hypothetical protein